VLGTPKSYKRRTVRYPAILDGALRAATAGKGSRRAGLRCHGRASPRHADRADRSWFDHALARAGLPAMTIHDLRHTAACPAVASGANVKAVQKMLGHASAAMTLDVYTDLFDDDLDAVAVRINDAAVAASVSKIWPRNGEGGLEGPPDDAEIPGIPGQ
jgi:integrase